MASEPVVDSWFIVVLSKCSFPLQHGRRESSPSSASYMNSMLHYRYLDGLRALGEVLLESMESFGAVSILCLLFLIVFTILGLHLFGEVELDIGFPNFNSFFNAFITVFQVCSCQPCLYPGPCL